MRPSWVNLNGRWDFAFDDDDRGLREGWEAGARLPLQIEVPFTFEAPLSGIGDTRAHAVIWYRRAFEVPPVAAGKRLLLHVGAADHAAAVWVNGRPVGSHRGGYASFSCDVTDALLAGENRLVVRVEDRSSWAQPRGKQIVGAEPVLIDYDRVTGIWQTVWLEPVPPVHVRDCWSRWDAARRQLVVEVEASEPFAGEVEATVALAGVEISRGRSWFQGRGEARVALEIPAPRLWRPESPVLYDLRLRLVDGGRCLDVVDSYAGLREWRVDGRTLLLNGDPFYFRALLDQGYFPGGWYTAPSDADFERDIRLMQAAGFNGARKHQKAEDPRWLWWADRLGFAVWSEMPSGRDFGTALMAALAREWPELVARDRMHPSIAAWVPLNESWGVNAVARSARQRAFVSALGALTASLDPTRPVVANDGWEHFCGDLWGIHSYETSGDALESRLRLVLGEPSTEVAPGRAAALPGADVSALPVLLTEMGGVSFHDPGRAAEGRKTWGYDVVRDAAAFSARLRDLMAAVSRASALSGFVWTQFTDVQQENNGLFYFDRTPKLPLAELRSIFGPDGRG